jgi:hypothetical protein
VKVDKATLVQSRDDIKVNALTRALYEQCDLHRGGYGNQPKLTPFRDGFACGMAYTNDGWQKFTDKKPEVGQRCWIWFVDTQMVWPMDYARWDVKYFRNTRHPEGMIDPAYWRPITPPNGLKLPEAE